MKNKFIVTVNEETIICTRPDGKTQSIRWADLQGVLLETTDLGPSGSDVFWVLAGEHSGCIVPMGATGEDTLIRHLKTLPEFDFSPMILAMGSTENQQFICWRRS